MRDAKTKVYFVLGDNGLGNSGNAVFGIYPTLELAQARLAYLKGEYNQGESGAEYMWISLLDVGPDGADCDIDVCG